MFGGGRESLPDVREWCETLPDILEWSGDPTKCLGGPPGCPRVVRKPSRMCGIGQETFPNVQEAVPNVWEWLGGLSECPRVVERPS